jgi:hypothetical protein
VLEDQPSWYFHLAVWDPSLSEHNWDNKNGRVTLAGDAEHPMTYRMRSSQSTSDSPNIQPWHCSQCPWFGLNNYLEHQLYCSCSATVGFEIGFSSEHSMILFLTHILCALTFVPTLRSLKSLFQILRGILPRISRYRQR